MRSPALEGVRALAAPQQARRTAAVRTVGVEGAALAGALMAGGRVWGQRFGRRRLRRGMVAGSGKAALLERLQPGAQQTIQVELSSCPLHPRACRSRLRGLGNGRQSVDSCGGFSLQRPARRPDRPLLALLFPRRRLGASTEQYIRTLTGRFTPISLRLCL
jgi:hypothetical protein